MYTPTANREDDLATLTAFMRHNPFCTLVTLSAQGLLATHLPTVLHDDGSKFGTLRCHIARGNSQWRDFSPDVDALAIFTGPDHYISASWYPGKHVHGEEVPTWNYIAVHAYGRLRAIQNVDWLVQHVSSLTDQSEANSPVPWKVSDAPADFIADQARGIVGLELEITRVQGRWKASQNRTEDDADAVMAALADLDTPASQTMHDLIRERRPFPGCPSGSSRR